MFSDGMNITLRKISLGKRIGIAFLLTSIGSFSLANSDLPCKEYGVKACALHGLNEYKHGNLDSAKEALQIACKENHLFACEVLGSVYTELGNDSEARSTFKKTCEQERYETCDSLGLVEVRSGNIELAREYFKKACCNGALGGCTAFGIWAYDHGNLDYAETVFEKVCNRGDRLACDWKIKVRGESAFIFRMKNWFKRLRSTKAQGRLYQLPACAESSQASY